MQKAPLLRQCSKPLDKGLASTLSENANSLQEVCALFGAVLAPFYRDPKG